MEPMMRSGDPPPPPCCCDMGMPNWAISQPYCNQFIIDRPSAYRTSNQKWFSLKLVYKNRGVDHGTNIGGFAPNGSAIGSVSSGARVVRSRAS